MRFQFLTDHVCIPFWKKTRYFGCSDVDCNFVSTHALWQAVFILKSSKRRILNYSCRHHLMWIGCKRNFQSNSLSKILPFCLNRGELGRRLVFGKVEPPPQGVNFSEKFDFPRIGRRTGGGNLVKSQLGGNFSGELFLYKTGVSSWRSLFWKWAPISQTNTRQIVNGNQWKLRKSRTDEVECQNGDEIWRRTNKKRCLSEHQNINIVDIKNLNEPKDAH